MQIPTSNSPIDWAHYYAGTLGWPVLPCHSPIAGGGCSCGRADCSAPGKHPAIKNGAHSASLDNSEIDGWWAKWPAASVAVQTGVAMWVLDVDRPEGEEALEELQLRFGKLPDTPIAQTGGGGRHYFFARPAMPVQNRIGFVAGLDVRGLGGYVLAAPSQHSSGRCYEWELDSEPWTVALALAPRWLFEIVTGVREVPEELRTGKPIRAGGFDPQAALLGAPKGLRDDTLFKLASYCRTAGLELEVAYGMVETCAANCEPPFDLEAARRKVDWVWRKYPAGWSEEAKAKAATAPWKPDSDGPTAAAAGSPSVSVGEEPPEPYKATDLGNAWRLRDLAVGKLRYCHTFGCWMGWDGARWKRDETGGAPALKLAQKVLKQLGKEALDQPFESDKRKEAFKFAMSSQSQRAINAMISICRGLDGVPVTPDELDQDPYLLNTPSGTVDLRTGLLHPHRAEQLITRVTPVSPDPEGDIAPWSTFLMQVMDGRRDLYQFLKRAMGYSLTGSTAEQCLFFAFGTGLNGKSTMLETLQYVMGDYATATNSETLMSSKAMSNSAEYDLARLKGARLVVAQETGQGRRLAEEKVKALTGSDTITARMPYGQPFTYRPSFKLWLSSNYKPGIRGQDVGIWRRIRLVPFDVQIAADDKDVGLGDRLRDEHASAILAWMIAGCMQWVQNRLEAPESVTAATAEYREEMDTLGHFLEECVQPTSEIGVFIESAHLYRAYTYWCERSGERPVSLMRFALDLKGKGMEQAKSPINRRNGFKGLLLVDSGALV